MSLQKNNNILKNGEPLTGQVWRKNNPVFEYLPFYSNLARMDKLAGPLEEAFSNDERAIKHLLIKFANGLDQVHPFSDTLMIDGVLRDAERILGPNMDQFVMLDRFAKTLFRTNFHPALPIPRRCCGDQFLNPAAVRLLEDLTPPTKLLGKFIKCWRDRRMTGSQYSETVSGPSSVNGPDHPNILLAISRRLIVATKLKNILYIETAMEMMALAISISSENNGVFPEMASDVKNVLRRIWSDRMDASQLEEIANEIEALHRSMKNLIEIVFAISPLLVLSTQGWSWRTINRNHLLKMFVALGNNRPPILVMLEDGVLECIVAICEGNSTQYVLDRLHSQLLLLESDLTKDGNAMQWFNLSTVGASMPPTPPHSHDAEDVVSNDNSENQLEGGVMEREEGEVMEREEGGVTQQEEGEAMEQEEGGMIEREEGEVMEQDVGGTGDEVIRIPRSRTSSMSSLSTVSEDSDQPMADIVPDLEPDQESSVMMEVDREDSRMSVDSSEDSSERGRNLGIGASQIVAPESNQVRLDFIGPNTELRRSSRNTSSKNHPILPLAIPPKSPPRKRKSTQKKHEFLLQDDTEDRRPKLQDIRKAKLHPTIYADVAGWGSTVEAGPKPYRHVPVEVIPPGNVASTGEDTETLKKVEARIQAEFKNGLPPHLQPNAKSMEYIPGTDQSRIFVASHSEFMGLHASDVQRVLRERLILVHGIPSDYNYGWDLQSMARLYDIDRKTTVHVASLSDPLNPELRHHQGTLRDLHTLTTTLSTEECPPLNAISLPVHPRNLYIPCQFGSLASHEVAQSRVPSQYESVFNASGVKALMEWCLVGSRGAISSFHVDSDGLGTLVVVLEGSKYWIVATRLGDEDTISSVDSLGPGWNPYLVNDGDNVDRFRFEAVHLQKGDMLIMPGGVPHWVLGTSNSICVGRHFYAASTIRSSVIGIVHTFLLANAVTNEDLLRTRTLLYQMMVFWSTRLDQTDVDGAHIPDLSSEVEFFDFLYLGIFIILSPSFDRRFFVDTPPAHLVAEVAHAKKHFYHLFHVFSKRFIIDLEGDVVALSYVVDRMLAEFAAAAVNFSRAIEETYQGEADSEDEDEDRITSSMFVTQIEGILNDGHARIFPFYSNCLVHGQRHFIWTGPKLRIHPRSQDISAILPLVTLGERLDLLSCPIYTQNSDQELSLSPANVLPLVGKRYDQDLPSPSEEATRKRKRLH